MIDQTRLDELRATVRGEILLPEDNGYDEARAIWQHGKPVKGFVCLAVATVKRRRALRARH